MKMDIGHLKAVVFPELEKEMLEVLKKTETSCYEMCRYQLNAGGKRLRALLPILVAQYFEKPHREVFPISIAAELTHNATLVHDDIQDGDRMRRNRETVWKKFGIPQAINCGNALFHMSFCALGDLDAPAEIKVKLDQLLAFHTLKTIEGQANEFSLGFNRENISLEKVFKIAAGKTSGLFIFPVVSTLILLQKPSPMIDRFTEVLAKLGVVFQIRDDLTDLYGDKGRESAGNDLREGKISSLIALFFELATNEEIDKMLLILKKDREITLDDDIVWAKERFDNYGIQKILLEKIQAMLAGIENSLRDDPVSHDLYKNLQVLFNSN